MAKARPSKLKSTVIASNDVEGVAVYDGKGKKIGTVDHLVIEKLSGRVLSVVITVGGFLGIGHSHCQVPWAALRYSTRLNAYETDATPEPV